MSTIKGIGKGKLIGITINGETIIGSIKFKKSWELKNNETFSIDGNVRFMGLSNKKFMINEIEYDEK